MIESGLIKISGKDAFKFLQGQLTCDMKDVTENFHPGALCNNKGRVISSFQIKKEENDYLIYLPKSMVEIVLKAFNKYAQFADINIETIETNNLINLLEYIKNKTAVILPETSELFTPHELNYQNLNFISFTKGCYKGQEIIARMQYLGKLKKKLEYKIMDKLEAKESEIVNFINQDGKFEVLVLS